MDLVQVTPPGADILSLADAKLHLSVESTDEDTLISGLIAAATAWLDGPTGVLGRCLINQAWRASYDYCFPSWRIPLPLAPLVSVTSITYVDAQGATQTVASVDYQVLDGPAGAVQPAYGKAWPSPRSQARACAITFTAGYGAAAAAVPAPLIVAAKLLVGHLYMNREAAVGIDQRGTPMPLPLGIADLIAPYRARAAA
jgi:uncharacterized phiE125 gp8 family phage protein